MTLCKEIRSSFLVKSSSHYSFHTNVMDIIYSLFLWVLLSPFSHQFLELSIWSKLLCFIFQLCCGSWWGSLCFNCWEIWDLIPKERRSGMQISCIGLTEKWRTLAELLTSRASRFSPKEILFYFLSITMFCNRTINDYLLLTHFFIQLM